MTAADYRRAIAVESEYRRRRRRAKNPFDRIDWRRIATELDRIAHDESARPIDRRRARTLLVKLACGERLR